MESQEDSQLHSMPNSVVPTRVATCALIVTFVVAGGVGYATGTQHTLNEACKISQGVEKAQLDSQITQLHMAEQQQRDRIDREHRIMDSCLKFDLIPIIMGNSLTCQQIKKGDK